MPTILVKVTPDQDRYVAWSSVVEAPVWVGTRAESLARAEFGVRDRSTEERLAAADESGTSALWGDPPREGSWEDAGFIYQQQGWLPRSRLGALCDAIAANPDDPDVTDLLDPFEDDR